MVAPLSRPPSQFPTWRPRAAAPSRRGRARGARGSPRGPREWPPSARVPRRMTWCSVPGASSRACRGILALALRLESWGTPSGLFLSVNNVPHYRLSKERQPPRAVQGRMIVILRTFGPFWPAPAPIMAANRPAAHPLACLCLHPLQISCGKIIDSVPGILGTPLPVFRSMPCGRYAT